MLPVLRAYQKTVNLIQIDSNLIKKIYFRAEKKSNRFESKKSVIRPKSNRIDRIESSTSVNRIESKFFLKKIESSESNRCFWDQWPFPDTGTKKQGVTGAPGRGHTPLPRTGAGAYKSPAPENKKWPRPRTGAIVIFDRGRGQNHKSLC